MESTRRDTADHASLQAFMDARVRACGHASIHLCMMVRDNHFEAPQSDVDAWESVLDLMLQELELSEVLRHPGLGLTTDGVLPAGLWLEPEAAGAPATSWLRDRQEGRHRCAAAGRDRCCVGPTGHSQPAGLGAQPRPGSMTMAGQNEQAPTVCPKCSANLIGGRDLPGCWRCGWEDYSHLGAGTAPLIGSSMSELAARDHSRQQGRAARTGERRE